MNERVVHDPVVAPPPEIDVSGVETPAYVIDLGRLRGNLGILADVQARGECKVLLALKGFAMWSVFPVVAEYLSGIAASSVALGMCPSCSAPCRLTISPTWPAK